MKVAISHHLSLEPMSHQYDMMANWLKSPEGFFNFSEMGTGKTLAAIGGINHLFTHNDVHRVLIVCPNTLKDNWAKEFKRSLVEWKVVVLSGLIADRSKRLREVMTKFKDVVVIVNYEALGVKKEKVGGRMKLVPDRLTAILQEYNPDVVIADECHLVKSHKTGRSIALKAIPARFKHGMTGTPLAQSPLDYFSIFEWIRRGYLGENFYSFRARYANVYTGAGFPIIRGYRELEELKAKVSKYSFRVLKNECLDLPPKSYKEIIVELNPKERASYDKMARDLIYELSDERTLLASTVLTKMLKLQQMTAGFILDEHEQPHNIGSSKVDALIEVIESLPDQKISVWTKFDHEVELIQSALAKIKRENCVLTGATPQGERQNLIDKFNQCKDHPVMILNQRTGGVGINLTSSSYSIFFSNSWSLADRLQAEDRHHRIGQVNKCTYIDLVAKKTIDQYIISVLKNKASLSDKLTGDDLKRIIQGETND